MISFIIFFLVCQFDLNCMDYLNIVVCAANVVALPCQRQFSVLCPLNVMISDNKEEQMEFVIMCVGGKFNSTDLP